jgi:hypothetical protein
MQRHQKCNIRRQEAWLKERIMGSRRELEALIIHGVQELRNLEARLGRSWAHLGGASVETRNRFFRNLMELETKVEQMERLTAVLDEQRVTIPRAVA